jgi:Domain of unknown function (DUF4159)
MIKRLGLGSIILILLCAGPAIPDRVPREHAEYVFARVKFHMNVDAIFQREAAWHHDYPYSEDFFLGMVSGVTGVRTNVEAFEIVELDSPDIFKYPFLYFSEPGFLDLTDDELKNLREYFNRGGFAMFDDFRGRALLNLEEQLRLVFPDRELFRLKLEDPIFHTFYEIDSLEMPPPYMNPDSGKPTFWGMKDDKDRLILVANADNDFGEFWEDIDHGREALHPAVQSFQFGVNYLIYAMTH